MKRCNVLIADDHDIVIEGLRRLLDDPQLEIVGTVRDGHALVREVARLQPDVIVTDISMPLLNGIDAARQIRKQHSEVKIIFLTMHPEVSYAVNALAMGNCGYVLKSSAADELVDAIHAVVRGDCYLTSRIAGSVIDYLRNHKTEMSAVEISDRERQILQLIAEGRTFKEVATMLNISVRTVEFHRNNISAKTGFRSTAELARYAARIGIVNE
jgi:DNA-binding NarL/FixJ family response regulator